MGMGRMRMFRDNTTNDASDDANVLDRWDLFASDSSYARPTLLYVRNQSLHLY